MLLAELILPLVLIDMGESGVLRGERGTGLVVVSPSSSCPCPLTGEAKRGPRFLGDNMRARSAFLSRFSLSKVEGR